MRTRYWLGCDLKARRSQINVGVVLTPERVEEFLKRFTTPDRLAIGVLLEEVMNTTSKETKKDWQDLARKLQNLPTTRELNASR